MPRGYGRYFQRHKLKLGAKFPLIFYRTWVLNCLLCLWKSLPLWVMFSLFEIWTGSHRKKLVQSSCHAACCCCWVLNVTPSTTAFPQSERQKAFGPFACICIPSWVWCCCIYRCMGLFWLWKTTCYGTMRTVFPPRSLYAERFMVYALSFMVNHYMVNSFLKLVCLCAVVCIGVRGIEVLF